jgi:phosphoglucomutase
VKLTPDVSAKLKEKLQQEPDQIGGRKIESINRIDGVKFLFENNAWMLMRPSGTEPMVRIYAESENSNDLEDLLEQGRKYLLG